MKILELFSGTESFSKVARARGHETFTVDNNPKFKPDLCKDILDVNSEDIPFKPDVIWASPPCTTFSIASVFAHWENHQPKSNRCKEAMKIIAKTLELIILLRPKFYFIENPMCMTRTLPILDRLQRAKVTYCQYGDKRMKPTDIWTNCDEWIPLAKSCKNRSPCHESAPRGSKTGTQGLKGNMERSVIPEKLCLEILKCCEEKI